MSLKSPVFEDIHEGHGEMGTSSGTCAFTAEGPNETQNRDGGRVRLAAVLGAAAEARAARLPAERLPVERPPLLWRGTASAGAGAEGAAFVRLLGIGSTVATSSSSSVIEAVGGCPVEAEEADTAKAVAECSCFEEGRASRQYAAMSEVARAAAASREG